MYFNYFVKHILLFLVHAGGHETAQHPSVQSQHQQAFYKLQLDLLLMHLSIYIQRFSAAHYLPNFSRPRDAVRALYLMDV